MTDVSEWDSSVISEAIALFPFDISSRQRTTPAIPASAFMFKARSE